jgi:cold shock CspA family protein
VIGTVTFHLHGHGWIIRPDGSEVCDCYSDEPAEGGDLAEGQIVAFDLIPGLGMFKATNITVLVSALHGKGD